MLSYSSDCLDFSHDATYGVLAHWYFIEPDISLRLVLRGKVKRRDTRWAMAEVHLYKTEGKRDRN